MSGGGAKCFTNISRFYLFYAIRLGVSNSLKNFSDNVLAGSNKSMIASPCIMVIPGCIIHRYNSLYNQFKRILLHSNYYHNTPEEWMH